MVKGKISAVMKRKREESTQVLKMTVSSMTEPQRESLRLYTNEVLQASKNFQELVDIRTKKMDAHSKAVVDYTELMDNNNGGGTNIPEVNHAKASKLVCKAELDVATKAMVACRQTYPEPSSDVFVLIGHLMSHVRVEV